MGPAGIPAGAERRCLPHQEGEDGVQAGGRDRGHRDTDEAHRVAHGRRKPHDLRGDAHGARERAHRRPDQRHGRRVAARRSRAHARNRAEVQPERRGRRRLRGEVRVVAPRADAREDPGLPRHTPDPLRRRGRPASRGSSRPGGAAEEARLHRAPAGGGAGGSPLGDRIEMRSGGRILVDQLVTHGVECAFTVPGESFLPVLDALYDVRDRLKLVVCRHEAGAANMAEAYGKLTNRPGICFVTRGPGAAHAAIGVHTAFQDSTPMILFIGDVGSDFRGREAFQEVDFSAMFAPLAKWADRIDDPARIPEFVARAFQVATSGRRGPVVLALPEDMLSREAKTADARRFTPSESHPGPEDMERLRALLAEARRPLVILGGSGWTPEACADMRRFVEANALPCACAFRFQDLFDNRHPQYVGDVGIGINPVLAERVRTADLLLVVGARLGEMTTSGYTLLDSPVPRQTLVHVHPGAEELGRVYQPELAILSGTAAFARAAASMAPVASPAWAGAASEARADYLAWTARREMPGRVQMWDVVEWVNRHVP